jgi:hypothetical protein
VICVEHVIGEEKYECEMLNVFVMVSKRFCGRVCCDVFRGFFWYFRVISLVEPYYFCLE